MFKIRNNPKKKKKGTCIVGRAIVDIHLIVGLAYPSRHIVIVIVVAVVAVTVLNVRLVIRSNAAIYREPLTQDIRE